MHIPQFTLDDYERVFADRHLLHGVVAKWAKARSQATAILSAESNRTVTWSDFDRITTVLARELFAWDSGRAISWSPCCRCP